MTHTGQLLDDKNLAIKFQLMILYRQKSKEHLLGSLVSDCTAIDFIAYWRLFGLGEYDPYISGVYYSLCRESSYDLLVCVPVEFPAEDDGFRLTSESTGEAIDRVILEEVALKER